MKLSIITINYNNQDGLNDTILSVLGQTYKDYEYIIIDGGSTDGSLDIIKKYENRISYWVSEPDKGIYHAMNKGVKVATGDYCFFLNSSDTLYREDTLKSVFQRNPYADIIYGNLCCDEKISVAERKITLRNLLEHTIGHQSSFIKRSLLVKSPYDDKLKLVSDWKFFFEQLIFNNASYQYFDIIISNFDMTGVSMTHQNALMAEREKVLTEILPPIMKEEIYKYFGIKDKYYELFTSIGESPYKWRVYNLMVLLSKIIKLNRGWTKELHFKKNN